MDEQWLDLEAHPTSLDELFAAWWYRHGDDTLLPGKNDVRFHTFRRGVARKLADLELGRDILPDPRRNLLEIFNAPHYRVTRKRIARAKATLKAAQAEKIHRYL